MQQLKLEREIIDYLRERRGQYVKVCSITTMLAKRHGVKARDVMLVLSRLLASRCLVKSKDTTSVRISELVP